MLIKLKRRLLGGGAKVVTAARLAQTFPTAEKFSLLRSHVKDEAATVIAGFEFIDANYQPAYDA